MLGRAIRWGNVVGQCDEFSQHYPKVTLLHPKGIASKFTKSPQILFF
jgi:hypothetical protein